MGCYDEDATMPTILTSCLIIFSAVLISAVIQLAIFKDNWFSPPLILKMPVKASVWAVLCTFMLKEKWALFDSELVQVSVVLR